MIFLAVTLGFFAKSLREHINDNQKREQYVQSLVEDLESDTARMDDIIQFDEAQKNRFKTACINVMTTMNDNLKATSCMLGLIKF